MTPKPNPEDLLSKAMPGEPKPLSQSQYEEDFLTLQCTNCNAPIENHRDRRWCE